MVDNVLHGCEFDFVEMRFSDSERVVRVQHKGSTFEFRMVPVGSSVIAYWAMPFGEIEEAFGECYICGLPAFIARLAVWCSARPNSLPIRGIRVAEIQAALDIGAEAFHDLIRRKCGFI